MKFLAFVLVFALLSGCASSNWSPTSGATIQSPMNKSLKVARQVLEDDGFKIAYYDDASGKLSTYPRKVQGIPKQADCANQKDTNLSIEVSHKPGYMGKVKLAVSSQIENEPVTKADQQPVLETCQSRSEIENGVLDKIIETLGE